MSIIKPQRTEDQPEHMRPPNVRAVWHAHLEEVSNEKVELCSWAAGGSCDRLRDLQTSEVLRSNFLHQNRWFLKMSRFAEENLGDNKGEITGMPPQMVLQHFITCWPADMGKRKLGMVGIFDVDGPKSTRNMWGYDGNRFLRCFASHEFVIILIFNLETYHES